MPCSGTRFVPHWCSTSLHGSRPWESIIIKDSIKVLRLHSLISYRYFSLRHLILTEFLHIIIRRYPIPSWRTRITTHCPLRSAGHGIQLSMYELKHPDQAGVPTTSGFISPKSTRIKQGTVQTYSHMLYKIGKNNRTQTSAYLINCCQQVTNHRQVSTYLI